MRPNLSEGGFKQLKIALVHMMTLFRPLIATDIFAFSKQQAT